MSNLLAARSQMAISLAFHILFAVAGMAMPLLMALAQWRHLSTGEEAYGDLARRWAKGTAILFAVGAVSGTVLSFELGLLWPEFMRRAGPLVGMPFSLEGLAFFLEAIFLGLYLYGWDKLAPRVHLACGVAVAVCGLSSAIFVTAVNAWMNEPVGIGSASGGEPSAMVAFLSPAFLPEAVHMALAAYSSVALLAVGIHSWGLLRTPGSLLHRRALRICLAVALFAVPLQILSGDLAAKHIAKNQPLKLAAAESLFETQRGAPLAIGGWPDEQARTLRWGLEIPSGLSLLATGSPSGEVTGLDRAPASEWPPVAVVHVAFQIMVACGMAMLALVAWGGLSWLRRRRPPDDQPLFLKASLACAPAGLIAIEAGWTVTEVGRQPWVITGVMRTAEAVTPMPGLSVPLTVFTLLYLMLGVVVVALLRHHVLQASAPPEGTHAPAPAEGASAP